MMRTLKGLGALLVLIGLLVGVPAALVALAGNPIPTGEEFARALTGVDYGGRFLMGTVVPVIGWLAWASFALSVLVEIPAAVRCLEAPRIGGLGPQQALAGALITAILALGPAWPAIAHTTAHTTADAPAPQSRTVPAAPAVPAAPGDTAGAGQARDTRSAQQATTVRHTVTAGDTLSELSQDYLADPDRWPELARATEDTVQPDGRTLRDPDLIYPGWTVTVPGVPAPAATSEAGGQPAAGDTAEDQSAQDQAGTTGAQDPPQDPPQARQQPEQSPAAAQPGESTSPAGDEQTGSSPQTQSDRQAESAAPGASYPTPEGQGHTVGGIGDQTPTQEEEESDAAAAAIDWRTTGGIGAFLAAGVLAVLGLRRTQQRRRRRPGQVVPRPEAAAAQSAAQLAAVADAEGADKLDQALKAVALWAQDQEQGLPEVFCVRVTAEQIALYLAGPAQLPGPFQRAAEDGTVWTIAPGQIEQSTGSRSAPSAPYPALVTIGQDATGAQLLLDLEYLGTLGVDGAPELIPEVLDAMAVELATSTWGEQLQITLVGVADGLAGATGTGRVRQIQDLDELIIMLRGRAQATAQALEDLGMQSIHEAKAAAQDESWMPEILLLGIDPTTEQAAQLRDLAEAIPRLGIAAVTCGNPLQGQWQLHIHDADTADLAPLGLRLAPQKITTEESAQIISVLSTSLLDPTATDNPAPTPQDRDLDAILGRTPPHLVCVAHGPTSQDPTENPTENPAGRCAKKPAAEKPAAEIDDAAPTATAEDRTEEAPNQPAEEIDPAPHPAPPGPEQHNAPAPGTDTASAPVASQQPEPPEPAAESSAEHDHTPDTGQSPEPELEDQTPEAAQPRPPAALASPGGMSPEVAEEEALDLQAQKLLEQAVPHHPVITLLGQVRIVGATGQAPVSASTGTISQPQTARCTALAAFLALNPGASAEQYHAAFWPNASPQGAKASSNRNKLSNLTRRYLGQDTEGTPYFPPLGPDGYRLDERITTDWQVVQDLIGPHPTQASTVRLIAAMRLVRGTPFKDVKGKNFTWAEDLQQTMIEVICDAAHELVTRSLRAGHHNHAQLAARVGRTVDPANEAMWRDALIAEAAAGNREEVARLIETLYQYLEGFDEDLEPEEETSELIDQLRGRGYRIAS